MRYVGPGGGAGEMGIRLPHIYAAHFSLAGVGQVSSPFGNAWGDTVFGRAVGSVLSLFRPVPSHER